MIGSVNLFRPTARARSLALFGDAAQTRAREKLGDPNRGSTGSFGLREWHKSAVFEAHDIEERGLLVQAQHATVDLAGDVLRVGLLWDDATILESPAVDLNSGGIGEEATSNLFRVGPAKGLRLEVWTAGGDDFGSATIVQSGDIGAVDEQRRNDQKNAGSPPRDALAAFGGVLGLGVIAVAAYLLLPLLLRART